MRRRITQVVRRALPEALLLAWAAATAIRLAGMGLYGSAALALGLGVVAGGIGIAVGWRSGDFALAWRCPRLDALALRAGSREAPWGALAAADAALSGLESCGGYREFFPEARRHLIQAAYHALAADALARRAREALADAPAGESRARLEAQEARALREIGSLTASLRELRARFASATAPLLQIDAAAPLRGLGEQSDALAESIDALHRAI
jgi:hypothetical protein